MLEVPSKPVVELVYQLIADAALSIGFMEGRGLGAVLLTVIAVTLVVSPAFKSVSLISLLKAWRIKK